MPTSPNDPSSRTAPRSSRDSSRAHLALGGRHSRREFLRRSALVAGAGLAAPWALDLTGIAGSAPVADAATDYRALVCVFLHGGNDHDDTLVPNDPASYARYHAARPSIARPLDSVLSIDPIGGFPGASTFGFAPEMSALKRLFDRGDAAVVANVGTLVRPTDKARYRSRRDLPPQLFSHNDQQSYWQSSSPEGATTGWGGRLGDLLLDGNSSHSTFTCVSVSGNAVLLTGREAFQYQVSSKGVTRLRDDVFRTDAPVAGIREIMELGRASPYAESYVDVSRRALSAADDLGAAVASADAAFDLDRWFDTDSPNRALSSLAKQLRMVAQLIVAGRDVLGLRRQVFFVSMGGFDSHSAMVDSHRPLLHALSEGVAGFHHATAAIGAQRHVTTFTASDFGRTLAGNGDGSDHGWGAHHFVVGGSVNGRRIVGRTPEVAIDGPDDVGRGRLLPTTSVDQYAATMARWMGAGSGELAAIVPNISNFGVDDLGFLRAPSEVDDLRPRALDTVRTGIRPTTLRTARRRGR
ncbi:DUF1501 domain-containing protein [Ilumatobacter sp.]|uniref:DUF1501 domain-containing protein n=1 Tax=Ilumatobacter sp. TaxID=1967498 RepID=UPI003B52E0D5